MHHADINNLKVWYMNETGDMTHIRFVMYCEDIKLSADIVSLVLFLK